MVTSAASMSSEQRPPSSSRALSVVTPIERKPQGMDLPRKPWPHDLVRQIKACLSEDDETAVHSQLCNVLKRTAYARGAGEFLADEIIKNQAALNALKLVGAFYNVGSTGFSTEGQLVSNQTIGDSVAYALQSNSIAPVNDDLIVLDYPTANAKFNPVNNHDKLRPNTWLFVPLMTPTTAKIVSDFITEHNTFYGKGKIGAISGVVGLLCIEEKKQPTRIDSLVGSNTKPLLLFGVTQTI
jgi:hypothetical protein